MTLFPQHIVKDLFWSTLFIIAVYFIIHNPIVRPIPKLQTGVWIIEKMQHPILFGLAGHNYLVLKNQNGDVISELHGLATDTTTGKWKRMGTTGKETLKVWEFDKSIYDTEEKNFPGIVISIGDKNLIENTWQNIKNCASQINNENIKYSRFGFNIKGGTNNSNSVAYTLSQCIGINTRHLGLITPGDGKNLLQR
jgi:hypothetical protein